MKITAKDLKNKRYQGSFSKQYEGDVEIEGNLGLVSFDNIWCTGSITAGLGTYIYAVTSIDAGTYINAGTSIDAGESINAGTYIDAGESIYAGTYIDAGESIYANTSINAGTHIRAVDFGITAGYSIICKTTLSAKLRIIAGASPYQDGNNNTITCGKLESGTIVGNLVETGLPDDRPKQCHGGQTGKFCSECGEKL